MIWFAVVPVLVGLVYCACDAAILVWPREFLSAFVPFIGRMLRCRICTSFWFAPIAVLMCILFQVLDTTAQSVYGVVVLAPIGGIGVSTILTALSPAAASRLHDGQEGT